MPVEEEEADAGPDQCPGEDDDVTLAAVDGGQQQGRGHDRDHSGGQAVYPIEEVDGVLQADKPQQAEGDRQGGSKVERMPARESNEVDRDPEERDRDQRGYDLEEQFEDGPQPP